MRMDKKDFEKMRERIYPIVRDGINEHDAYIDETASPTEEDSEILIRYTLNNVKDDIQQFLIDEYDFVESDFDHFPELDELIYHANGWTLRSAIHRYYNEYNTTRDKAPLKVKIENLIRNESQRLCYTVFDSSNDNSQYFKYVTIGGENRCGACGEHYGTFQAKIHPSLPPYHAGCGCWAVWHD